MPLFQIERRTKAAQPASPRPAAAAGPARAGSPLPALLAGAVTALAVLGGIAWFLIGRTTVPAAPLAEPGVASGAPAADGIAAPAPISVPDVGFPTVDLSHVAVLNADFPRDTAVASVNGVPISMAQLETRVRVARTLGTLAGDPVPGYDNLSALRTFEVQMLRRSIDVVLIQQAARAAGVVIPPGSSSDASSTFLAQVNAAPAQLEDAMASNGVTQAMLDGWFASATLIDFYVQTELMAGHEPSEREAVVKAWIDAQWAAADIQINFYDPDNL